EGQLEDSDALVADPGNARVVIVKARVRQNLIAHAFGPTLVSPSAVAVTLDRHAIVATAAGFTVLDRTGGASDHALAGGPFTAVAFSDQGGVIFLASASAIQIVRLDLSFAIVGSPSTVYDNAGSAVIRGLALKSNGDLLFT